MSEVFSHPLPHLWVERQLPTAALLLLLNDAFSPETLPNTGQRKLDGENPCLETSFKDTLGNTPPPEDLRLPGTQLPCRVCFIHQNTPPKTERM